MRWLVGIGATSACSCVLFMSRPAMLRCGGGMRAHACAHLWRRQPTRLRPPCTQHWRSVWGVGHRAQCLSSQASSGLPRTTMVSLGHDECAVDTLRAQYPGSVEQWVSRPQSDTARDGAACGSVGVGLYADESAWAARIAGVRASSFDGLYSGDCVTRGRS